MIYSKFKLLIIKNMKADDFQLSTNVHIDRKNLCLLWKGITELDFFKCKFYLKTHQKIEISSKENSEGINCVFIETKKRISQNFKVENFVAGGVLPEELYDNDELKGWASYKRPNQAPKMLVHEYFVRKPYNRNFISNLPISDIDLINDESFDNEAMNLFKSKEDNFDEIYIGIQEDEVQSNEVRSKPL